MPAPIRPPTLAQRYAELAALALPGASLRFIRGAELRFRFHLVPSEFGRSYECELRMRRDATAPEVHVLEPDLDALAQGRRPPHVYASRPNDVALCLWLPKPREWVSRMSLKDTYIPWTAQWLAYFEFWLESGVWDGGGVHPADISADPAVKNAHKSKGMCDVSL